MVHLVLGNLTRGITDLCLQEANVSFSSADVLS